MPLNETWCTSSRRPLLPSRNLSESTDTAFKSTNEVSTTVSRPLGFSSPDPKQKVPFPCGSYYPLKTSPLGPYPRGGAEGIETEKPDLLLRIFHSRRGHEPFSDPHLVTPTHCRNPPGKRTSGSGLPGYEPLG